MDLRVCKIKNFYVCTFMYVANHINTLRKYKNIKKMAKNDKKIMNEINIKKFFISETPPLNPSNQKLEMRKTYICKFKGISVTK